MSDRPIAGDPIPLQPSNSPPPGRQEPVPEEKSLSLQAQGGQAKEGSGWGGEMAPGAGGCGTPGGIHNRPPIPGAGEKAECPKFMSHGPCGGVRKGGYCEVFPEMMCPWVVMYFDLEKLGKTEWMTGI